MKNNLVYYEIGALLYCPANKKDIAETIINEKLGTKFSLALCLEDTINDQFVAQAEQDLIHSVRAIYTARQKKDFYIPKIFIRVRASEQILRLTNALQDCIEVITGFILPKFSLQNCDEYLNAMTAANEISSKKLYTMPIYESNTIIDLDTRTEILYRLKESLDNAEELIMNIRVGGNDLSHAFGFRRHVDETIYKIRPVANIFSDLVTVYGRDYIISGPVWEYYNGPGWEEGMLQEIKEDQLCGFTGKTVIHPNQISVVNEAYKVLKADYEDALEILNWNNDSKSMVNGSHLKRRMNEYKTHTNWARKIMFLSEAYGIKE